MHQSLTPVCKWKKSSIIKVLIILFGHLWEEELTYRYIFAFKLTLRSQQLDIVLGGRLAAGAVDTLTCEYLRKFSKTFKTVLMEYSGVGGKLIHEKTRSEKSRDTVPLK